MIYNNYLKMFLVVILMEEEVDFLRFVIIGQVHMHLIGSCF